MTATADISGLLKKLSQAGEGANRMAKAIVQSTADQIVADAKTNAPADLGALRQSIGKDQLDEGYQASIFANAAYAAYVEFGTGVQVDVPPEMADIAAQFKGKGTGSWDEFELAIEEWMKRHGIGAVAISTGKDGEEEFKSVAYLIMMAILKNGLKPQPFLYPAFVKGRAELGPKLETAIKRYVQSL